MDSTRPKSVDDYIASQPESMRPLLERVRRTIRKARAQELARRSVTKAAAKSS